MDAATRYDINNVLAVVCSVTNAQFPEHIASLGPVTQLYVSIDGELKPGGTCV